MHIADSERFYRPRSADPKAAVGAALPAAVREAIDLFLQRRAVLLISSPEVDRKTYCDHPALDRLDRDEQPEEVCVSHFADNFWPHRWGSMGYQRSLDPKTPEGQVYQRLNLLRQNLAKEGQRDVAEIISDLMTTFSRGTHVNLMQRVRQPRNQYGVCVEDIEYHNLTEPLSDSVAEFMASAHNAVIALLGWLDSDLEQRQSDHQRSLRLMRREEESERKLKLVLDRERRHREAVKKVKGRLAQQKAETEALLATANQRMAEAMAMAALAQGVLQRGSSERYPDRS